MKALLVLALMLVLPAGAGAQSSASPIEIDRPWSRAAVGKTGVVYMTIKNRGGADDRLSGASTPVANEAQLHVEFNDSGVMKMRPIHALDVKANATVTLKPGGTHVMLVGLKQPLKEGDSFPLTLEFEKAGKIDVTVAIMKAGASGDMGGMKM